MAKKILIVDDEAHIRQLLGVVLKGSGYEPSFADNGMEALQAIQKEPPDLVILDVTMPHLGGWDVLSALRSMETTKTLPVLMCTSKNLIADVEKADALGATSYIPKPFDIDRILKKVKDLIGS